MIASDEEVLVVQGTQNENINMNELNQPSSATLLLVLVALKLSRVSALKPYSIHSEWNHWLNF